jgi:hypothetical protein
VEKMTETAASAMRIQRMSFAWEREVRDCVDRVGVDAAMGSCSREREIDAGVPSGLRVWGAVRIVDGKVKRLHKLAGG